MEIQPVNLFIVVGVCLIVGLVTGLIFIFVIIPPLEWLADWAAEGFVKLTYPWLKRHGYLD